jgi:hypothetical protein
MKVDGINYYTFDYDDKRKINTFHLPIPAEGW